MSISGILSNTYNQYQIGATPNPIQQQIQQLGTALQSGNLSAAQSDFASLQAAFSQPSTTTGAPTSTAGGPVNQAFNQLASDLQSGNLSAAQKDFATVQQDIHGPNGGPSFSRFPIATITAEEGTVPLLRTRCCRISIWGARMCPPAAFPERNRPMSACSNNCSNSRWAERLSLPSRRSPSMPDPIVRRGRPRPPRASPPAKRIPQAKTIP